LAALLYLASDPAGVQAPQSPGGRRVRRRESSNAPNGYDRRRTNANDSFAPIANTSPADRYRPHKHQPWGPAQLRTSGALINAARAHTTGFEPGSFGKDVTLRARLRHVRASAFILRRSHARPFTTRAPRPLRRPVTSSSTTRAWPAVGGEDFWRAAHQLPTRDASRVAWSPACCAPVAVAILRADAVRTRASRAALPHSRLL